MRVDIQTNLIFNLVKKLNLYYENLHNDYINTL